MPLKRFKNLKPGDRPTSSELNRLADAARSAHAAEGGGDLAGTSGSDGAVFNDHRQRELVVRITGGTNPYSWVQCDETDPTLPDLTGGFAMSGDTTAGPAYEINGRTDVYSAAGGRPVKARAWLSPAQTFLLFQSPTFGATNVCPTFASGVITSLTVETTRADGTRHCVTNPVGCCPEPPITTCTALCPSIPRRLYAKWVSGCTSTFTSTCPDHTNPLPLDWDGAGWVGISGGGTGPWSCGATFRLFCGGSGYISSAGDALSATWLYTDVTVESCSPVCMKVTIPASGGAFNWCADGGVFLVSEDPTFASCGTSPPPPPPPPCTGHVYSVDGCCPGVCWPSPLTLTVGGSCAALNGTYSLTWDTAAGLWKSATFTYNSETVQWEFGCAGGDPRKTGIILVNTATLDQVVSGTCSSPNCAVPSATMDTVSAISGGTCNGITPTLAVSA